MVGLNFNLVYFLKLSFHTANPKCEKAGCGEWKPPVIDNPAYKGKWSAPLIDNPSYKVNIDPLANFFCIISAS